MRQYIGARYVPIFFNNPETGDASWLSGVSYEPLTMVTYANNTYTSKKTVPSTVGAPNENSEYWISTGNYNAQVEQYRQEVEAYAEDVEGIIYLEDNKPVNALSLGIKNDGSEDCSVALNAALENNAIFLPEGIYRIDNPINAKHSIIGAYSTRLGPDGTIIKANFDNGYAIIITGSGQESISLQDFSIECQSRVSGIGYTPNQRKSLRVNNVSCWNATEYGINVSPASASSRCAYIDGFTATCGSQELYTGAGIYFNANAVDCAVDNFEVMYFCCGLQSLGGGLRISNGHVFTGRGSYTDLSQYFERSRDIDTSAGIFATNIYIDSACQGWVQRSGNACIGNIFYYADSINYTGTAKRNVLRCDQGATINCSNIDVSGDPALIASVCAGDGNISIANCVTEFANNALVLDAMPILGNDYIKRGYMIKQKFLADPKDYCVVACVKLSNNFGAKFSVTRGRLSEVYTVFKNNDTLTITRRVNADFGDFGVGVWYKVDGSYLKLYINNSVHTNEYQVDLDFSSGFSSGGLIDIDAIGKGYNNIGHQNDSTGLTQLSITT